MNNPQKTECTRKLRHLNFLSALQHAIRLADDKIRLYHCRWCGFIHLGHAAAPRNSALRSRDTNARQPENASKLERAILRTTNKIARQLTILRYLPETARDERRSVEQSLASLRVHLKKLQQQAESSGWIPDDTALLHTISGTLMISADRIALLAMISRSVRDYAPLLQEAL